LAFKARGKTKGTREVDMACWLYQINAENWSCERYRNEVWEGQLVTNWTLGEAKRRPKEVKSGDMVILFFVKAGTHDPGIYGWGIITSFYKEYIDFRPSPPSDYLKMNPVPLEEVNGIIRKIRGRFAQMAMFKVKDEEFQELRQKVAEHVYGVSA
jgi:hypothetical protein